MPELPKTFETQICLSVNPYSRAEHPPRTRSLARLPAERRLRASRPTDFARKPLELVATQKAPPQGSPPRTSLYRPNASRICPFGGA